MPRTVRFLRQVTTACPWVALLLLAGADGAAGGVPPEPTSCANLGREQLAPAQLLDVGASLMVGRLPEPSPGATAPLISPPGESLQAAVVIDLATHPDIVPIHYPADGPGSLFAFPLALTAADVNLDGVADVLLNDIHLVTTAVMSNGEIHAVFGPFVPGTAVDLDHRRADVTVHGREPGGLLARTLAVADVNGDTVADLTLLSPRADTDLFVDAGEAYVFEGPVRSGQTHDLVRVPAGFTIGGDGVHRVFSSIATGDVTGDALADLVLAGGENCFVIAGPTTSGRTDLQTEPPAIMVVASMPEGVGSAVAVGDVDGDGIGDVLLGVSHAVGPGNRTEAGQIRIFLGPLPVGAPTTIPLDAADIVVDGAGAGDRIDRAWVGDLDDDGRPDLVVTGRGDGPASSRRDAGVAHVLFGPLRTGMRLDLRDADLTVHGVDPGDAMLNALVADVTGDGIDDLLLGAHGGDGPSNTRADAGEVYMLAGPLGPGIRDLAVSGPDVVMYGAEGRDAIHLGDWLGHAFAAAELTGDGRTDLLIGAAMARRPDAPERTANGTAFVLPSWTLFGDRRPSADAGGPYAGVCRGVLGIWLDATESLDPDPGDTLSYLWTTTCAGRIDQPTQPTTAFVVDCNQCFPSSCDIELTATDSFGATDVARSTVLAGFDDATCLEVGNSLRAVRRGPTVELSWEPDARAASYLLRRAETETFAPSQLLHAGPATAVTDGDTFLTDPDRLFLYRMNGLR